MVKLLKNILTGYRLKLPCSVSVRRHYRDFDHIGNSFFEIISSKTTNRTKYKQRRILWLKFVFKIAFIDLPALLPETKTPTSDRSRCLNNYNRCSNRVNCCYCLATIWPSSATILMIFPVTNLPARISCASGFSIYC